MGEGGGTVLFEEKVAHPRERVAGREAGQQPPEVQRGEGVQYREQAEAGADEMQAPANAVSVLGQIERIELRKASHAGILSMSRIPLQRVNFSHMSPDRDMRF